MSAKAAPKVATYPTRQFKTGEPYPVRYRRNGSGGEGFYEVFIGGPDGLRAIAFCTEVEQSDGTLAYLSEGRIAIVGNDPMQAWRYEAFAPAVTAAIEWASANVEDSGLFNRLAPVVVPR